MIVAVSYAWLTISESPVVNGIQVTIGGGHTILLAPDVTKVVTKEDGTAVTVHYPGAFGESLDLSKSENYTYLSSLAGLSPVSTADGIQWFIPTYDETDSFVLDDNLTYANQEANQNGYYIYLDFWIVSPGSEYDIRVSNTSDGDYYEGSYLIELPQVVETEEGDYTLAATTGMIESCARVGFLVNDTVEDNGSLEAYMDSDYEDSRYEKLLGVYQEPGESADTDANRFTIYEPNATEHDPEVSGIESGVYAYTKPLGGTATQVEEMDLQDCETGLTVQTQSQWSQGKVTLEEAFQAAIAGKTFATASEASTYFYDTYLQKQFGSYLTGGKFLSYTSLLYQGAGTGGDTAATGTIDAMLQSGDTGATEDAIITTLERNTPQRIRMYIWLEGQDVDCKNTASVASTQFALNIQLAGATK
jgi:hypothetical protein